MRKKFLRKNSYNSLLLRRYRTQKNIGGVQFWQIAFNEENGEEYFGISDDRSSVVSRYLRVLVGKILAKCAFFTKLPNFSPSNIFPCMLIPTTHVLQEY